MIDAVKVVADGIRLEKKITKSAEKHDYRSKIRSATHDATDINKDDSQIIINATTGGADKSAETDDTSSANRTETNEPADNAGETNDKKESE